MIPAALAKKLRYIEIVTCKTVNESLAGEYHSVFKGQGIEFVEVREYQPGDEVRSIDWNVTARMARPFVKKFVEERELTIMLLIDLSGSNSFGSRFQMKNEVISELCALVAFSAIKNNDKVGLIIFTDQVERYVPPSKGSSHVMRLIKELLCFKPCHAKTSIQAGIDYLMRVTLRRCVVFLVSDFLDSDFEKPLRVMGRRHDLIAIPVMDDRELQLSRCGLIELEDSESGEIFQIDTGSSRIRNQFAELAKARMDYLNTLFDAAGIDHLEIRAHEDYSRALAAFFRRRALRSVH